MGLSTVTSKGQMTIPADIRRQLNLNTGDKVHFMVENGQLLGIPAKRSIRELKGIVPKPTKSVSIEDMKNAVLDEAGARMTNLG